MPAKRDIPTIIFVAICVVSAASLIIQTKNYVEFFVAIQRLDLTLLSVDTTIDNEVANVTLAFAIINPTGYDGLRMIKLSYILYLEQNTQTVTAVWNMISYDNPMPINAYSNLTFQHTLALDPDLNSTKEFIKFYQDHQGNVKWLLNCGCLLSTFLDKMEVSLKATYSQSRYFSKSTLLI